MRGQVTLEYFVVFMTLIFVGLAFSFYIADFNLLAVKQAHALESQRIADTVASEINTAFLAGTGYSRAFSIPQELGGDAYSISIDSDSQLVFIEQGAASVAYAYIISSNVSGLAKPGNNTVVNVDGGVRFY